MRTDLNALALPELFSTLVKAERLDTLIELALEEDFNGDGDVTTSSLVPPDAQARASIVARSDGVIAGLPVVERMLAPRGGELSWTMQRRDGERCARGDALVEIRGALAALLPVERTVLNALGRLCGIATLTRRFVDATAGTKAKVCCTRKTTPGWRELEKYAVRCGGGWLHRIGLYDAMLIKDNHLAGIATDKLGVAITAAARTARRRFDLRFVEVEVDSLEQLDEVLAIEAGVVDIILLDNFTLDALREAVKRRGARRASIELEASGGVRLETIAAIAATGVERISCGAITHSAAALDVALDIT